MVSVNFYVLIVLKKLLTLSELSTILLMDIIKDILEMLKKISDRGIPPYIGWATWDRLIKAMKTFVPPRLDRSYFNSLGFSGTQYSQAIRAFSFLSLMDENKRPTEKLRQLVMGAYDEQRDILKSVVETAYKPFFDNPGPREATLGSLESFMRSQGAKGVVDKCVTFFLSAAKEAGIPLSPQLSGEFGRKAGRRIKTHKKGLSKRLELPVKPTLEQSAVSFPINGLDLRVVSYVAELPEEKQDKWIKAYIRVRNALKQEGIQPD